jgi:amino-acid N-acetyltransferase
MLHAGAGGEDGMTIAPAKASELPAIEALLEQVALPRDGLTERLLFVVARDAAGGIAASAGLEEYAGGVLLRSVAVRPALRGTGLGQRLTREALELAASRGHTAAYLLTTTAPDFFARFGFAPIDRAQVPADVRASVEFVSACPASAIVMRAALPRARDRQV